MNDYDPDLWRIERCDDCGAFTGGGLCAACELRRYGPAGDSTEWEEAA